MKTKEPLVCELPHHFTLTLRDTSGRLTVKDVASFLAIGIKHFKHHRDNLKIEVYPEPSYRKVLRGSRGGALGEVEISIPQGEQTAPIATWVEVVIDAYSNASTVEDILEQRAAWKAEAAKEGGPLLGVIELLCTPGMKLQGLAAMLKYSLARDAENRCESSSASPTASAPTPPPPPSAR